MSVIRPRLVTLFMCSKTHHVSISLGRTLPALHSLHCALPPPIEGRKGKMVKKNVVLSVRVGGGS